MQILLVRKNGSVWARQRSFLFGWEGKAPRRGKFGGICGSFKEFCKFGMVLELLVFSFFIYYFSKILKNAMGLRKHSRATGKL